MEQDHEDLIIYMKTILVYDELVSLELFEMRCRETPDIEIIGRFDDPLKALEYARSYAVEFAVLCIPIPGMCSIELGKQLKIINPLMILIYVTGESHHIVEILRIRADYFILKPYDQRDVNDVLMRAKLLSKRMLPSIRVNTFGRFEVFKEDTPINFRNGKARELFALCIDRRGAIVTMEEAIEILWSDRPYDDKVKRLYRKALSAIQSTLTEAELPNVFVAQRGSCHVNTEAVNCDLYHFLDGNCSNRLAAEKLLTKGYIYEYSWAEESYAALTRRIQEGPGEE